MALKKLNPITIVEITFNGKTMEVEFSDGIFYSKQALIDSSSLYVDEHDESDNFYSTDPIKMIKVVGELSMQYVREIVQEYEEE